MQGAGYRYIVVHRVQGTGYRVQGTGYRVQGAPHHATAYWPLVRYLGLLLVGFIVELHTFRPAKEGHGSRGAGMVAKGMITKSMVGGFNVETCTRSRLIHCGGVC